MIVAILYAGLLFAAACALYRLLIGPTLADRIIALDVMLVCLMVGITIDAANREETVWLNLLVVIAIIGFTATVATTRFIERTANERTGT
jgi:multicomponent Na+:H+ antiporter subunit F